MTWDPADPDTPPAQTEGPPPGTKPQRSGLQGAADDDGFGGDQLGDDALGSGAAPDDD